MDLNWACSWRQQGRERQETTWTEAWAKRPRRLYESLTKAQATALFLLRTEVIGLNRWLATQRVPGISPACPCGWEAQTVQHVLLQCRQYDRATLLPRLRSEHVQQILSDPDQAKAAAQWFIKQGVLKQFRTAKEIQEEDQRDFMQVASLETWV